MTHLLLWPLRIGAFVLWYAGQLVQANTAVVVDILTRRSRSEPRILAYDCRCASGLELALLTVAVSLTPGSLVVAVEKDPSPTLYVHCMYGGRASNLAELGSLETRLLSVLRPRGLP